MKLQTKRVYDSREESDGLRVLVDRLWPRGLSKEKAALDFWAKEVAPSEQLRKWFNHEPEKWPEFQRRYLAELAAAPEQLARLREEIQGQAKVTLLFGAKDRERNQAQVLLDYLKNHK